MLRAVTVSAASALGIAYSDGVIAMGRAADIIAVDGDPVVDVTAFQRVRFVMVRGRVVNTDGSDQPASRATSGQPKSLSGRRGHRRRVS